MGIRLRQMCREEDLGATLKRLRSLERSTAVAIQELLTKGRTSEAIALRHQHAAMIKSLFDSETKAMKLAEQRGELITTKRAEAMIVSSLAEPVMMLRQLPGLARDLAQRESLTTFMNACLDALREGARKGERSTLPKEARPG